MKTTFESLIHEIGEIATSDYKHPLLVSVRFIFADDKPNGNNQGIKHEDFPEIIRSAIDTPIKMKFLGEAGAGGHAGSVVMGHIRGMTEEESADGSHRLIADGVLYADEYKSEVEYLKDAYAAGKAPGASWELSYTDEIKEGPISWLKGVITRAATFVRNPAYGVRTALLSLASDNEISDEDLSKELLVIAQEIGPKNTDEGGSNTVEEELKKLQEELDAKIKEIEALTQAKAELEAKITETETALAEKDAKIAEFEKAKVIAERTAKVTEAGLKVTDEALAKKQEFWASLSEDAFAEYLADLSAAAIKAPAKGAMAGLLNNLPRVDSTSNVETVTIDEMKTNFRARNRGPR